MTWHQIARSVAAQRAATVSPGPAVVAMQRGRARKIGKGASGPVPVAVPGASLRRGFPGR